MKELNQGDIIKVNGFKNLFVAVSSNEFIRATKMAHLCPIIAGVPAGPLHIQIIGSKETLGTVICEQIKLIDINDRGYTKRDRLHYPDIMNIADAVQSMFEYD